MPISRLAGSGSVVALLTTLASAAYAQSQASSEPGRSPSAIPSEATPRADTGPDEIIVTGLRRDEKFINAPVAVQVFNSATIERAGITRPQDFLNLTPNVTISSSGHAGDFFVNIRGQASVRQSESAVAVVIDGVQLATQNEFNGELFDIEQIEVLKGPQGAYYGRNAAAGAIIITTKAPTDTFEGQATASYGNYNSSRANLSIGGPIIPGKLRFRAAASFSDTDGSYTNIVTGEKSQRFQEKVGRFRLDYDSGPLKLDARLNASRGNGGGLAYNAQIIGSVVGGLPITAIDTQNTRIPFVADVPGTNRQDKFSTSLKADYDLDFGVLTSVTAYNTVSDRYQGKNLPYADYLDPRNDFGVFAAAFGDRTQKFRLYNRAFTQELRLSSKGDGPFQWQVGGYFLKGRKLSTTEQGLNGRPLLNADGTIVAPVTYNADGTLTRTLQGGGVILPTAGIDGLDTVNPTDNFEVDHYRYTNYAPFANVQYSVTDRLDVRLAGRYDIEKRSLRNVTPDIPNPVTGASSYNVCVLTTGRAAADCVGKATFKQFQPKASITYKVPSLGSVYASWGRSFKSGGFNPIGTRTQLLAAPGADPTKIFVQDTYPKEVGTSYEAGFKSQFFDRRLSFNGAIFQTDVTNAQQFEFFPTAGIQAVSSIDKTRIKGLEFDVNLRVSSVLSVFGGYGYIDSKIRRLASAPQFVGNRTPYSAKDNLTAGIQVNQPLSDALELNARVDYTRIGSVWYDASNLPGSKREPVDLVNARLGLVHGDLELNLWSKNLLNKRYNSEALPLLSILNVTYKAPLRTYGLEAKVRF